LPFHSSFRLSLSLESLLCRGAPGCAALLDSIYFRIKSLQIKMSTANESVLKKTDIQQLQITELSEDNTRKKQKVMHFEFLITSEYKIPCNTFPRLPMWSSTMLNALLALDTMPGVKTQFGRLPMKHIYSTPFHDEPNVIELELLETVLHYINTKFPSIHNVEEKARVERSTRKFWQTFISNSVPTLQSYIDEAHSGFGLQNPSQANRTDEPTTSHFLPIVKSNNTAADPSLYKLKMEDHSVLESFLSSIDFTDFPGPHILPATFDEKNTKVSVEYLIQSFSESLHIDKHIDFHLLMPNASSFTTALLGTDVIKLNGQTKTDIGGSTTFQGNHLCPHLFNRFSHSLPLFNT
uniref:Uncharacterized protein n=1 Tax=Aegilops tauschii subsp. strangulata TaxID=200361 RepID=A0A453NXQ3_AEGTS